MSHPFVLVACVPVVAAGVIVAGCLVADLLARMARRLAS